MNTSSMRLSAMNFLAIREHSILELRQKLKKKFVDSEQFSDEDIEDVLSELIADRLLSDERFTEVYIRSKMNKGFGPVKICYDLQGKGIARDIIDDTMQSSGINWLDILERVWHKKFSDSPTVFNDKQRQKQTRFLSQRGFKFDQINAFLKKH